MGKIGNGVGNTLGILPRGLGTGGLLAIDTLRAGGNVFSDIGFVVEDTSNKLKEVLTSSWNTGKWYNKIYQVPVGAFVGAGTLIEGAVRTIFTPISHALLNIRDITGNFFKNIGNTIGRVFDTIKPVSDFSFEHLQTKKPSGKNWLSNLAWWNKPAPAPTA